MTMLPLLLLLQAEPFQTAVTGRHHEGPRNVFDYVLVVVAIVTVIVVTVLCVKYFARPGEKNADHIKRRILSDDAEGAHRGR